MSETTETPSLLHMPRVTGTERAPPDPGRTKEAFGRIGYTLSEAIADLVDNSIEAKAHNVLIRFLYDKHQVLSIFIVDDGLGMAESQLSQAMRFGVARERNDGELGKYGIGLKSASFSQCNSFSVVSRAGGVTVGRKWTEKSIERDWLCEKLDPDDCSVLLDAGWAPLDLTQSGTAVIWTNLSRLHSSQKSPQETINGEIAELDKQLGLTFHRFIESGELSIYLDSRFVGAKKSSEPHLVNALNPFSYPKSGDPQYPQVISVSGGTNTQIDLNCHVWPPKSRLPEYRLGGGKVSARQGLYFYRNDRLVQAGGWNGIRDDDSEPHLSLARIAVDLPPSVDVSVQKARVIGLPPEFISGSREATQKYIKAAQQAYRRAKSAELILPVTLGKGVQKSLATFANSRLNADGGRADPVDIRWKALQPGLVFDIDIEGSTLFLNDLYRKPILKGEKPSAADAQLFKSALFLLVKDYFNLSFLTKKHREGLDRINEILLRSLDA